ncbi:hypothetical protein V6Z12_A02G196000 [Gossypium hirsutum]
MSQSSGLLLKKNLKSSQTLPLLSLRLTKRTPIHRPPHYHRTRWPTMRKDGFLALFQGAFEGQNAFDP